MKCKHGLLVADCKECTEADASLYPLADEDLRGKTPEELVQTVELLDAHLRDMHQAENGELRDMDEDTQKAFDYGIALREKAMKKIEEHRNISNIFSRRPESVRRVMNNLRNGLGELGGAVRMTNPEARDAALRVLDSRDGGGRLNDEEKVHVERQIRKNPELARRILVTETDDYRNAWMKLITDPQAAATLSDDERNAMRAFAEYRAMAEGTSSTGGYGIPVFIDPSIILTAQGSDNPFLTIARQVNVNTNAWKGVSSDGVTWSFDAEASTVSDDSPTLAQPQVNVFTARGFIPFSIEVGEDYPGFAEEMATLLSSGYDDLLLQKFTVGSGTGEPMGIVTALSADTTVQVHVTTNGSIGVNDPYKVWSKLPQRFRRNAKWLMSVGVNNAFRELGTADQLHALTVQLPAEWLDNLFNKATYEAPHMSDVSSTAGTPLAVVGDFQNYVIARRTGMSVELLPLVVDGTTGRPTGQRGWFAYARIGGGPATNKAFRLLNNS